VVRAGCGVSRNGEMDSDATPKKIMLDAGGTSYPAPCQAPQNLCCKEKRTGWSRCWKIGRQESIFYPAGHHERDDNVRRLPVLVHRIPFQRTRQPGELVLDFNRLQNPPCAYTPYATCPLLLQETDFRSHYRLENSDTMNETEAQ